MANPDVSKLTSSADIFSGAHTLPQIRTIHRSLHVQVEEKASRLRTQVGNSYRELLGTADTIVRMRGDNEEVQEVLGLMGGRCGRGVIGTKATSLGRFSRGLNSPELERAAKLKVLDGCGLVAGRILKGGGGLGESVTRGDRLVLASKVLVLIRLLGKSIGGGESQLGRTRREIESSLDGSRRRLLQRQETDIEDVLKGLCAYSLATSSGSRDVLRHLLRVRGEAMAIAFEVEQGEHERRKEDVLNSLQLYTRTLLDVQALVPQKLSQALLSLKSRALLADPTLQQLEGLRLDVYKPWCGDDIRHFTPFIRHDDLDRAVARDMLSSWTKQGGEVLIGGLKRTLEQMSEFKSVIDLRTSVLEHWIREGSKAKGIDPSDMQDSLREAINARLLAIVETKVKKLRLVGSEVKATLEGWRDGITDKLRGLWDEDGCDVALSNGAAPFIEEVVSRLYGRSDAVSKASHCYSSWYHVIDDVMDVVESLTKQRWDNDYDEIEDEETLEARQQMLSKDDPEMLKHKLNTTLDNSFEELHDQLQTLWKAKSGVLNSGAIAMYMLRVLRDIRKQLPDRPAVKTFGLDMVPALHNQLAVSTLDGALKTFTETALTDRAVICRPLWEGEPPLPVQPSPGTFLFLRDLSTTMAEAGMDLWTPAAVRVLKKALSDRLTDAWKAELQKTTSEPTENGNGENEKSSDQEKPDEKDGQDEEEANEREEGEKLEEDGEEKPAQTTNTTKLGDLYIQWLFDISVLQQCLGQGSGAASEPLKGLQEAVVSQVEIEGASKDRISKTAEHFWQRTYLLFGLIA